MIDWKTAWRVGFAPSMSAACLRALGRALESNDDRLAQGATTYPPALGCTKGELVEKACAIAYCGWQGVGLPNVGDVDAFFAQACRDADSRLGYAGACKAFLHWFDYTPAREVRSQLLFEIYLSLQKVSY